jgi:hypothetical protein
MDQEVSNNIFTQDFLDQLLPEGLSDRFFEALYGDSSDGAYNITLEFVSVTDRQIILAFNLIQRPGKCLVCSLTYGLPNVFSRHPLINIKDIVKKIEKKGMNIKSWRLGNTKEQTSSLHTIPLYLDLE